MPLTSLKHCLAWMTKYKDAELRAEVKGRKGTVAYVIKMRDRLYCLTYKRDWFERFSSVFKIKEEKWKGRGQTLNLEILEYAVGHNADILIAMPDYSLWSLGASEWLYFARRYGTIRVPSTENSQEASVPEIMLKRLLE